MVLALAKSGVASLSPLARQTHRWKLTFLCLTKTLRSNFALPGWTATLSSAMWCSTNVPVWRDWDNSPVLSAVMLLRFVTMYILCPTTFVQTQLRLRTRWWLTVRASKGPGYRLFTAYPVYKPALSRHEERSPPNRLRTLPTQPAMASVHFTREPVQAETLASISVPTN